MSMDGQQSPSDNPTNVGGGLDGQAAETRDQPSALPQLSMDRPLGGEGLLAGVELRDPKFPPTKEQAEPLRGDQGMQNSSGIPFKDVMTGRYPDPESRYLWTIDERGINIVPEWSMLDHPPDPIKHTNLSLQAKIGGEAWFLDERTVAIDTNSGRFGHNVAEPGFDQTRVSEIWGKAVEAWHGLGYDVVPALPGVEIDRPLKKDGKSAAPPEPLVPPPPMDGQIPLDRDQRLKG
jgi:hypothetical protein